MGTARPRFRGRAVFLLLNGNFKGFDGADNCDVRLLGSGKPMAHADDGGPRICDGQENGG